MKAATMAGVALALAGAALEALAAQPANPQFQQVLKAMQLEPAVLAGLDAELAVPQAWIDAAAKEAALNVRMTLDEQEFARVASVFNARYPGIKIEYVHGIGQKRVLQPLLAFKRGTVLSDVLFAVDSNEKDLREAGALTSLRDLPGFNNVPPAGRSEDGTLVAGHRPHYCMSYNTQRVRKEELPKTWDELVDNPRWHNGKVGMAINVHTWVAPLAGVKGDAWAHEYMKKIFTQLKPQLRKEQLSMTPRLNALGEFDISVPAGDYAVIPHEKAGMPVSLHCPDLVAKSSSSFMIMKGTPHPNASKVFVNWALSKEGQITFSWAGQLLPSHKDLQIPQLMPYPKEVLGKRIADADDNVKRKFPWIIKEFNQYWNTSGAR